MKNIFNYIIGLVVIVMVTSCDPLEDDLNLIQANIPQSETDLNLVQSFELILEDDDYKLAIVGEDTSSAYRYKNFSSDEDVKKYVPAILASKYPRLGEQSAALVTYDFYKRYRVNNEVSETVSDEYYADNGYTYGNFSSPSDMTKFCENTYPDAEINDLVELTYEYYAGSTTTETSFVMLVEDKGWLNTISPSSGDYYDMGQRFSNLDDDVAADVLPIYLKQKLPYAAEGDFEVVIYDSWNGSSEENHVLFFDFIDGIWIPILSVTQQSLQFGHDGTAWVPDNTISVLFGTAEYAVIGAAEGGDRGANLIQFGSYYQGSNTGGGTWWSDEEIIASLVLFCNTTYADAEVGQKYLLGYTVYLGSGVNDNRQTKFIKNDAGEYEIYTE